MAPVLKTAYLKGYRGFESLPLRHCMRAAARWSLALKYCFMILCPWSFGYAQDFACGLSLR